MVSQLDLTPVAETPGGRRSPDRPARTRAASRPLIALVLIVIALSAVVRLINLDAYSVVVFDEHYYVHDANSALHGRIGPRQPSPWKPGNDSALAHPPLGTLSIAAGILTLGNDPWGWRVPSAIAGTLLIALVYPLARRLRLSPRWALAALLLAASDTMLIVESRLGVLDPFVALWSMACVYCALRYVQSGRPTRWLLACGAAGGLALASKWSGVLALVAAAAIVVVDWALERRREWAAQTSKTVQETGTGQTSGAAQTSGATQTSGTVRPSSVAARLTRALVCLVALPLVLYVASYADYFASGHTVRQWLHLQGYMATFNWQAHGNSPMASAPLTWIFDADPIWYRWAVVPRGVLGMIAIANPLLVWASVVAVVGLLWAAWRQRDAHSALAPLLVCALYLPWLATSRVSYIYYLTPVIPFLAVAVAAALARLDGPVALRGRWAALAFAAGALLMGFAAGGTLPVRLVVLALAAVMLTALTIVARRRVAAGPPASAAQVASAVEGTDVTREPKPAAATAPARPMAAAAWLYTGAVAGLAVAWLPFLVSYAAPFAYYARLAWLTTWR